MTGGKLYKIQRNKARYDKYTDQNDYTDLSKRFDLLTRLPHELIDEILSLLDDHTNIYMVLFNSYFINRPVRSLLCKNRLIISNIHINAYKAHITYWTRFNSDKYININYTHKKFKKHIENYVKYDYLSLNISNNIRCLTLVGYINLENLSFYNSTIEELTLRPYNRMQLSHNRGSNTLKCIKNTNTLTKLSINDNFYNIIDIISCASLTVFEINGCAINLTCVKQHRNILVRPNFKKIIENFGGT